MKKKKQRLPIVAAAPSSAQDGVLSTRGGVLQGQTPAEVVGVIFTMLDLRTRASLAQTCQSLRSVSKLPSAVVPSLYRLSGSIPDWVRPLKLYRNCALVPRMPSLRSLAIVCNSPSDGHNNDGASLVNLVPNLTSLDVWCGCRPRLHQLTQLQSLTSVFLAQFQMEDVHLLPHGLTDVTMQTIVDFTPKNVVLPTDIDTKNVEQQQRNTVLAQWKLLCSLPHLRKLILFGTVITYDMLVILSRAATTSLVSLGCLDLEYAHRSPTTKNTASVGDSAVAMTSVQTLEVRSFFYDSHSRELKAIDLSAFSALFPSVSNLRLPHNHHSLARLDSCEPCQGWPQSLTSLVVDYGVFMSKHDGFHTLLSQLPSLVRLSLGDDTPLHDMSVFSCLPSLRELQLDECRYSGDVLCFQRLRLPNLVVFDMKGTHMESRWAPADLARLLADAVPAIQDLSWPRYPIGDFHHFTRLTHLHKLDLRSSQYSSSWTAESFGLLAHHPTLRILVLPIGVKLLNSTQLLLFEQHRIRVQESAPSNFESDRVFSLK